MKNLVRVSLSVLAAVALISFVGCKNDSEPEPAPANFEGEWKSTDGAGTLRVKDGEFSTVIEGSKLEGTYTVDGNTATTSKVKIPAELTGDEPRDMVFGKPSSNKPDLTGNWTGKVPIDEEGTLGEATIFFANNNAILTGLGQQEITATVTQDGNFFTITWGDDHHGYDFTGLISDSGKAWLDGGFVFTKK